MITKCLQTLSGNEALHNPKVGTESGPVKYKYSIQLFSFAFEEICSAEYDKIVCIVVEPLLYCSTQTELELFSDIFLIRLFIIWPYNIKYSSTN